MEKYTFRGREYEVEELSASCCTHAVMTAHPEWTEEEALSATFRIYHDFCITLKLWVSRNQRKETLSKQLLNAFASGSTQEVDTTRKEIARLNAMTDEDYDKEQEEYLLYGYSDAELLRQVKEAKTQEIERYDTSDKVNGFKLNGNVFWLDKATRVGLMNSTTIAKGMGNATTDLWLGEVKLTIDCDKVIRLLGGIEMYALECFNVTARHKAEVAELKTVEDVEKYDIKEGYPKQLEINLDGLDRQ